MTSHRPSITGVREEIWHSLVSMVRVYASAAMLNGVPCTVTEITPEIVLLRSSDAELELRFQPASGAGSWTACKGSGRETYGSFELSEVGTLQLEGEEKQLDQAAIEWVEDVTRCAAQQKAS